MIEMGSSSNWKSLGIKIVWILAPIILTVITTNKYNDYAARAKPYIELVSTSFERRPGKKIKIIPSLKIINLLSSSGIYREGFSKQHTVEKWESMINELKKRSSSIYPQSIEAMEAIIADLKILSLDTSDRVNEGRRNLIKRFYNIPGGILEKFTISILKGKGHLKKIQTDKSYEKYLKHPEGWESEVNCLIYYAPNHFVDLSESNPKQGENLAANLLADNVYKRIWIYMDKDFMITVFREVADQLKQMSSISKQLVEEMNHELDRESPKRIQCIIALSNIGKKPAIIRGDGLLKIYKADKPMEIKIQAFNNRGKILPAFPLGEGNAVLIDFYSSDSIEKIESTSLPNLVSSYEGKNMSCDLVLYRLTEKMEWDEIKIDRKKTFGPN